MNRFNKSQYEIEHDLKIKNRNNIFKITLTSIIVISCLVRMYTMDIESIIELTNGNFSDLMAFLVSFFAIGISVLFYIKNNELTNNFNQNNVSFINDILVSLSAMNEKFGEKLTGLKENYKAMHEDLYNGKFSKDLKKEEKLLDKQLKEKDEIIEKFIENAKVSESEKEELKKKLSDKDRQLSKTQSRIRNSISHRNSNNEDIPNMFFSYLSDKLPIKSLRRLANGDDSVSIRDRYMQLIAEVPYDHINFLQSLGYVDSNGIITIEGYEYINNVIRR